MDEWMMRGMAGWAAAAASSQGHRQAEHRPRQETRGGEEEGRGRQGPVALRPVLQHRRGEGLRPGPVLQPAARGARRRAEPGRDGRRRPPRPSRPRRKPAEASPPSEPAKAEPAKTEPAKTEPAKAEPAKTASRPRPSPPRLEPAKAEPAKAANRPRPMSRKRTPQAVRPPGRDGPGPPTSDDTGTSRITSRCPLGSRETPE